MAPLILEGETLGEKHRHYNKLLNKAIETPQKMTKIDYDHPDIDNLFKIDIACHQRDVQYILSVLKCEDMLYVSKAIKKSKWLITNNLYADIINPKYLHNELFPHMTSKAKCKFMLQIRLVLKDEKRVEQFFYFLEEHDLQSALKWLPNCSYSFIDRAIKKHATIIPLWLVKRVCEKSITFLDIFCQKNKYYWHDSAFQTLILQVPDKDFEKCLNILEEILKDGNRGYLNRKVTKKIMKNCPQRIMANLEIYLCNIDVSTFAKYLKEEEVHDFIKSYKKKKEFTWIFTIENIKFFLKRIPAEKRFDFVKEHFFDKRTQNDQTFRCSNIDEHEWYQFAPFDIAMTELKKLILSASNPTERKAILNALLICAGSNMQNVETLIDFYRTHHINEPYKFKIQFVNSIIRKTKIHEFEKNTWVQMNDLFISMEVYEESNNNVQECIKAIILYNVLHNEVVPAIIEKKFEFDTFVSTKKFLSENKKEMLFNYLYDSLLIKLNSCDVLNDTEFTKATLILRNALCLLIDWKKDLCNYPTIIKNIRQLIQIKNDRTCLLPFLNYCLSKSVKRIFFEESIFLNPTEDACLNALKYNPKLLNLNKIDVQNICLNDAVILKRLLNKVRTYWSYSMARQLKTIYFEKLELNTNCKAAVSGLCILLPSKESQEFVKKYAPSSDKINWSVSKENQLAIQRNLGKKLHLAKPPVPLDIALLYAKGDYLQYVLPSINALLYNISPIQSRAQIENVLNAPVSLQKHGIKIVTKKFPYNEVKTIFRQKWGSTKNKSIRSNIFIQTFKMLCTTKDPSISQEIWELLSEFIDNLTTEEDKIIYVSLSNVHRVPLPIKVSYWIKSYTFLKSLPEKSNCSHLLRRVKSKIVEILEFLSVDNAAEFFTGFFETDCETKYYVDENVENLALYLLSTKDKKVQHDRYVRIFLPILEKALSSWNEQIENRYYYRHKINEIVQCLIKRVPDVMQNMVMPIVLFNEILQYLKKSLSKTENYILLTNLKLALCYIQILDTTILAEKMNSQGEFHEKSENNFKFLYPLTISMFSESLTKHLRNDVNEMYSSIYLHFSDVLDNIIQTFSNSDYSQLKTLQAIIDNDDSVEAQLLVLTLLHRFSYVDDADVKALQFEIGNKISQHPSHEVNAHYWRYRRNIDH